MKRDISKKLVKTGIYAGLGALATLGARKASAHLWRKKSGKASKKK